MDVMADDRDARIAQLEAENAALRDERTATAEVLRAIAGSPHDLRGVLDTIAESAVRLVHADSGTLLRLDEGRLRPAAAYGARAQDAFESFRAGLSPNAGAALSRGSIAGRAMLDRRTVHVPDVAAAVE